MKETSFLLASSGRERQANTNFVIQLRYGVDVQNLEAVWSIYEELKKVDAFKKGGWRAQPDTPEEFREKE